jgi:hypothetical protein
MLTPLMVLLLTLMVLLLRTLLLTYQYYPKTLA